MTTPLSKEAAELVQAGRQALQPTAADRARVAAALKANLPNVGETPSPAGAASVGKAWLAATGVVAALAVGVGYYATRTPNATTASVVSAPIVPAAVSSVPMEPPAVQPQGATQAPQNEPEPATKVELAAATPTPARATPRAAEGDGLAEEVRLLTQAEKEFHSGNLGRALMLVDQHRREFPRGRLASERIALRVQVLCGLGRTTEAAAEQKHLGRKASGLADDADVCKRL